MSADLGQGAFDQKPTGLGCNIGCLPSVGDIHFKGDLLKEQSDMKLSCTEIFQ